MNPLNLVFLCCLDTDRFLEFESHFTYRIVKYYPYYSLVIVSAALLDSLNVKLRI